MQRKLFFSSTISKIIVFFFKIQNLESENYTLQENLSTSNNTIEEHKTKEKDFEESVNGLTHKVSMLEKAEEDYLVSIIFQSTRLLICSISSYNSVLIF